GWLAQAGLEVLVDRGEEVLGGLPLLLGADEDGEVLGHLAALDGLDDDVLEGVREVDQRLVAVELAAVRKAARPGVDRGDRVGAARLAGLVLTVVAGDRAVRGLRL